MSLSYKNQSIDLQSKSMGWFLYDRDLRHERVKYHKLQKRDNSFGTDELIRSLRVYFNRDVYVYLFPSDTTE